MAKYQVQQELLGGSGYTSIFSFEIPDEDGTYQVTVNTRTFSGETTSFNAGTVVVDGTEKTYRLTINKSDGTSVFADFTPPVISWIEGSITKPLEKNVPKDGFLSPTGQTFTGSTYTTTLDKTPTIVEVYVDNEWVDITNSRTNYKTTSQNANLVTTIYISHSGTTISINGRVLDTSNTLTTAMIPAQTVQYRYK